MTDIVDFVMDFETLGKRPNSVVLSFAITFFPRNRIKSYEDLLINSHYWKFDVNSQIEAGRVIDQSTIEWWEKQDKAVKDSQILPSDKDVSLDDFMVGLVAACDQAGISRESAGFCRGQSFDFPLLVSIIDDHRKAVKDKSINPDFYPCAFWNQRDVRSYIAGLINDVTQSKVPLPTGTLNLFKHHDPVHDCVRAVLQIQYAEGYSSGDIDVPDEIDVNSYK